MFVMSVTTMVVMNCVIVLNVSLRTSSTHIMTDTVRKVRMQSSQTLLQMQYPLRRKSTWICLPPWINLWPCVNLQVFLNILPRLLKMRMRPWTPNKDSASEIQNRETLATDGDEIFLVPCRRRSSVTLITKAEEYVMKTARTELMFSRLKERNGLMKSVLERLSECLSTITSEKTTSAAVNAWMFAHRWRTGGGNIRTAQHQPGKGLSGGEEVRGLLQTHSWECKATEQLSKCKVYL